MNQKKTRKLTVSIGIPVYNEEANIKELILRLVKQEQDNYMLKEIMVFFDGTTDNSVDIVKSLANRFKIIKMFIFKKRSGQQAMQNLMLKKYSGDLLMIVEGDALPADTGVIDELVHPFKKSSIKNLGIAVGNAEPVKPVGLFEKVMTQGSRMKSKMFSEWRGGDNIYCCNSAKILSRNFTQNLTWPLDLPEDVYTYFRLKQLNLKMVKQHRARFYFRNVTNFKDRKKQCTKFISGRRSFCKYFEPAWIKKEYSPPFGLVVKSVLSSFFRNPVLIVLYLLEVCINRITTLKVSKFDPLFMPHRSSKTLIYKQTE